MKARDLEWVFEEKINRLGGKMLPITFLPGYLIILPGGHVGFIIVGSPPEKQENSRKRIHDLKMLGCAAGRVENEKQMDDAIIYIMSDACHSPNWYRFIAENGRRGEDL